MVPDLQSSLLNDVPAGVDLYWRLFVALIAGGLGLPIPEDVPLVIAGIAIAQGLATWHGAYIVCYVGVLLSDQVLYGFGYLFGQKLLSAGAKSPFLPSVSEERIEQMRLAMKKRRLFAIIFAGRHLFPIRSVTFVSAGALRIPFVDFFIADALAAFVSVSIVIGLGWLLGNRLSPEVIHHIIHEAHYYVIGFCLLLGLVYALQFVRKRRLRREALAREM